MIRKIVVIILCTILTASFASQYGSISGYVLDKNFKPLYGTRIYIENMGNKIENAGQFYDVKDGEADKTGYFKILGIDAGTYTLKFDYVGYIPHTVTMVQVKPDSDTEIIICIQNEGFNGPPPYHDYDASDAKITPYNPSQKNIDLEKTGKVDFKEKSKYPKLDFAEKYYEYLRKKSAENSEDKIIK